MQNHVCQVYLQGIALCKYECVTYLRSMFLNLTFLFSAERLNSLQRSSAQLLPFLRNSRDIFPGSSCTHDNLSIL